MILPLGPVSVALGIRKWRPGTVVEYQLGRDPRALVTLASSSPFPFYFCFSIPHCWRGGYYLHRDDDALAECMFPCHVFEEYRCESSFPWFFCGVICPPILLYLFRASSFRLEVLINPVLFFPVCTLFETWPRTRCELVPLLSWPIKVNEWFGCIWRYCTVQSVKRRKRNLQRVVIQVWPRICELIAYQLKDPSPTWPGNLYHGWVLSFQTGRHFSQLSLVFSY